MIWGESSPWPMTLPAAVHHWSYEINDNIANHNGNEPPRIQLDTFRWPGVGVDVPSLQTVGWQTSFQAVALFSSRNCNRLTSFDFARIYSQWTESLHLLVWGGLGLKSSDTFGASWGGCNIFMLIFNCSSPKMKWHDIILITITSYHPSYILIHVLSICKE